MTLVAPGVCRFCGCRDEDPCAYCKAAYDGCNLVGEQKLVCAGPGCVKAEAARKERNAELARQWRRDGLAEAGLRGGKGRAA